MKAQALCKEILKTQLLHFDLLNLSGIITCQTKKRPSLICHFMPFSFFYRTLLTRHIEEAYRLMYERYQADLPPDHLFIES